MSRTHKKLLGFLTGVVLASSAFVGSFLTSSPALAIDACPAFPAQGYPYTGMAGMKCVSGDCQLLYACQIGGGNQIAHTSCAEFGSSCLMGPQCLVRCEP